MKHKLGCALFTGILVFSGLAGCNPMVEKELTITNGAFRYLTIGASKTETLSQLVRERIDDINPRFTKKQQIMVTRSADIHKLAVADEIIAEDRGGGRFSARVAFRKDEVVDIVISDRLFPDLAKSLAKGTSKDKVLNQLAELMAKWPNMVVYNVIPGMNSQDADPRDLTEEAREWLLQYDVWHYSDVAEDGYPEIFLLHFEDDQLTKIEYTKLNVY